MCLFLCELWECRKAVRLLAVDLYMADSDLARKMLSVVKKNKKKCYGWHSVEMGCIEFRIKLEPKEQIYVHQGS